MKYTSFNQNKIDTMKEPMFFGQSVNIARYDIQKYPVFEKLIEKQISFFWRPEEIDLSMDRKDFASLQEHEKHIFLSNLKYQILLDSVQGRSPNIAFLPVISIPELETWVETWAFYETIHSRSYTHIIRNIVVEPSEVFDSIIENQEIIKRAKSVTKYYDEFIELQGYYNLLGEGTFSIKNENGVERKVVVSMKELKKLLYLNLVAVFALEAIRFYVSFACSFSFAERKLMEGNAKVIRFIARDEALHANSTQQILNLMHKGFEGPEMQEIAESCRDEVIDIFAEVAEQEKEWASYLFSKGSVIGLNKDILCKYVEYITDVRLRSIGFASMFNTNPEFNPIPWIEAWLSSDAVQVAPQETELVSYLIGAIDSNIDREDFDDFDL
jgi:ribonucleoside-diphosphate reductase beta chain